MRVTRVGFAVRCAVISCFLLAGAANGQAGRRNAPAIHLTTALGGAVVSNYIEPSISLGEDSYVFVISIDLDRTVRVLHPDGPGLSVKMTSGRRLHLPRFFAGFADDGFTSRAGLGYAAFDGFGSGYTDSRGTLIGLASRKPFNLSAITLGGDWDLDALRQLVDDREPYAAASALARYLGARGEPIGRDVHRFAGGRHFYNTSYASRSYYDCASYYGSLGYARAFSSGYAISYFRAAQFREAGYVVRFLGVDACGRPQFIVYPHAVAGPLPARPPATGAFPEKRLPVVVPRNPTRDGVVTGRTIGTRPQTPDRYTEREVPMAPPARATEPRRTVEKFHPQPATGTIYERPRVPRETAPAPARAPERVAPPVYIPERIAAPSPPPPPPPRIERVQPTSPPESKPVVDG